MRVHKGFTLIELLLAFSLGSFVILGMMETYRGVIRYLERSRSMMQTNRKVCLLFNQIERDFSTAYIPQLHETIVEAKKTDGQNKVKQQEEKPRDKKKVAEEKKKRRKTYFVASVNDQADFVNINGKRKKPFKSVNFICSHPFQVYGQKQVRLVRVEYALRKDKAASKSGPEVYQLWRKETTNLSNKTFKEEVQAKKKRTQSVKKYIVADDIKSMVVEFVTFKKKKKKATLSQSKPPQEVSFFTWSDKKETIGVVPQKLRIWIDFWNDRRSSSIRFHGLFPVFSFPTVIDKEKDQAKERKKVEDAKGQKKSDGKKKQQSSKDGMNAQVTDRAVNQGAKA